jgi:hypothetical protein
MAASLALVSASSAFAAEDPVASGTLKLKLSSGFKKQLKSNGVKMKPKKFKVVDGDVDPLAGTGTVELKGKLTFKKGGKKLVYRKLTAKIGKKGNLKGSAGKVFQLKGGKVTRVGFGASINGMKLKFLKGAAKKVNKKLDLDSLHKGNAGKANAKNLQPEEVTLVSGTANLVASIPTFTKFAEHCVDPTGTGTTGTIVGITPIAPASESLTPPTFSFPVTGGALSPTSPSGLVNAAGGILISQNIKLSAVTPGCDEFALSGQREVRQSDLVLDLETHQIQAKIVISGTGNPVLDGDKGVAYIGTVSGESVSADPTTRKVIVSNAAAAFNATAATVLNGAFPCEAGEGFDPTVGCTGPNAFVAGDPIGVVNVNAQAQ